MNLGRALNQYGTDRFKDVLLELLYENVECFPLEDACEMGGYPDLADTDISLGEVEESEEELVVPATVCFSEDYNTSCADVVLSYPRAIDCSISINRETGDGEITEVEVDYREDEF